MMTINDNKKSLPPPPHRRRLEDSSSSLSSSKEYYDNLYGTGSYPFGQAGGEDSACELYFYYTYGGELRWSYSCFNDNAPIFVQDDDVTSSSYRHRMVCGGQETDFDNFSCRLSVADLDMDQYPWFGMVIKCRKNDNNNDDDNDNGCTCSEATVNGVSCDLCETCATFSTSEIASWTTTPSMIPNLHLSCPADSIYGVSSQLCPTRIPVSVRGAGFGLLGGVLFFGGVIGTAMATTAYWFRGRRQQQQQQQKRNETALLEKPKDNDKEESRYAIHTGGVAA